MKNDFEVIIKYLDLTIHSYKTKVELTFKNNLEEKHIFSIFEDILDPTFVTNHINALQNDLSCKSDIKSRYMCFCIYSLFERDCHTNPEKINHVLIKYLKLYGLEKKIEEYKLAMSTIVKSLLFENIQNVVDYIAALVYNLPSEKHYFYMEKLIETSIIYMQGHRLWHDDIGRIGYLILNRYSGEDMVINYCIS